MELSDKLLTSSERETDGSRTISRYDFQTHWGVSKLFECCEREEDFAIAFEFHDDIVVVDNIQAPKQISFYQVKGKETGNWTLSDLSKREAAKGSEKKPSILGKMHQNRTTFGPATKHLGFVSNQPATFIPGSRSMAPFSTSVQFKTFLKKIKDECPGFHLNDGDLFHFHKTDFGVVGYERYVKGAIVEFITRQIGRDLDWNCEGFYLSVIDQCRRQSKNLADLGSLPELAASKFITRADVEAWVQSLLLKLKSRPDWNRISLELADWGAPFKRAVQREWDTYTIERMAVGNRAFDHLRDAVRHAILGPFAPTLMLSEVVEQVLPIIRPIANRYRPGKSDNWIRAAIIMEWEYDA